MRPRARPWLRSLLAALAISFAARPSAAEPPSLGPLRVTEKGVFGRVGGVETKLTLDPKLQRSAERLLAESAAHEGAIVASDPRTGQILAWASRGGHDYVARAFAPSASLFKIVTVSALLDTGRASPASRACFDGGEHAIEESDLDRRGHVCASLSEAVGKSLNVVVARLASKSLAPHDLDRYASLLGFVGPVPIDVPAGASDLHIPDDRLGFARASAGFWNGHLTPLGALFAMQTIANDGERVRLSLLAADGARVSAGRAISAGAAAALTRMLELTTRRGTAAKAFTHADGTRALPSIPVAAKTGTLIGGHPGRMYSWFASFAPSTKPTIAVAVMLGNDVTWTTKANLVGRRLLEAYFEGDREPTRARVARAHRKASRRR